MKVNITSVHFKTDKKLEDFIQNKMEKLNGFYEGIIGGDVILKLEKKEKEGNKIAEIKLKIPGNDLYAKKQSKTFEQATDSAIEALKKQLTKHKEKIKGN
jgi:putative sigma-54 modulation protein